MKPTATSSKTAQGLVKLHKITTYIINRGGATVRASSATLLIAVCASLISATWLSHNTPIRAQSPPSVTTHQISPSTFSAYFDIDGTTQVATLKSAYLSAVELVFASGDYVNPIEIDAATNVTLRGANGADSADAAVMKVNNIVESTSHSNRSSVLFVKNSTNVTVDAFKFDFSSLTDASSSGGHLYGIFFLDSSGTISDSILDDLRDANSNASKRSIRVATSGATVPVISNNKVTNSLGIVIRGNTISNPGRIGIQAVGYLDLDIDGNTIKNNGPDDSDGIQIIGGAGGILRNNHISGFGFQGPRHGGAGIGYLSNMFVPAPQNGQRIETHLEIKYNTITRSAWAIGIGGAYCPRSDGMEVDLRGEVARNNIYENVKGGISIGSCVGSEDEDIEMDVLANDIVDNDTDTDDWYGTGIDVSSSFNGGDSAIGKASLNVRYNNISGQPYGLVHLHAFDEGVMEGTVTATHNYWDTLGPLSPANKVFDATYDPWFNSWGDTGRNAVVPDELPGYAFSTDEVEVDEESSSAYTLQLNSAPSGDVTVVITSNDPSITVNPSSVVFTPLNWNSPQRVTVNATPDDDAQDNPVILWHSSTGEEYEGLVTSIGGNIRDNDDTPLQMPGDTDPDDDPNVITQSIDENDVTLTVDEDVPTGAELWLSDAARQALSGPLQITIKKVDGFDDESSTEEPPPPDPARFATGAGSGSQTIVDISFDNPLGGDIRVCLPVSQTLRESLIGAGARQFTLLRYSNADDEWRALNNVETIDRAGSVVKVCALTDSFSPVAVSGILVPGIDLSHSDITIAEGDNSQYRVRLDSRPNGEVTVAVSAPSGLTASTDSLTFNASNWNTYQTVTISAAQDDDAEDGSFNIEHTASGGGYDGVSEDLSVSVTDDDTNAITLSVSSSLTVAEGASKSYGVRLSAEPTGTVTVSVAVPSGLTASSDSLTFNASNWNTYQTVTISAAQDDDAEDGSFNIEHTASGGGYGSVTADLPVRVTDDERKSIALSVPSLTVAEGASKSYDVRLSAEPTGTVTVSVAAPSGLTASTDSLRFDASNWSTDQRVTISAAQDDDAENGSFTVAHTASGGGYDGVSADLSVDVTDNDTNAIILSVPSLNLVEGASDSYRVRLSAEPTGTVTVSVAAPSGLTASPDSLTFDASNWSTDQRVTISAAQDDDAEDGSFTIAHTASGGGYGSVTADLPVRVTDDERKSIALSVPSLTVAEGASKSYDVRLSAEPTGTVTVSVSAPSGLIASHASLTFDASNWNTDQRVTISAEQDDDAEDESLNIEHTASGGGYGSVTADLPVRVTDDERKSIALSVPSLTVAEGASKSYDVRLSAEPTGTVTVSISPDPGSGLTASPDSLTFDASNWSTDQRVTISAALDADAQDEIADVSHLASGGGYAGLSRTLAVHIKDLPEPQILRIEPRVARIHMMAGNTVRIAVNAYDLNNKLNENLIGKVSLSWDDDGNGGKLELTVNDHEAFFTAPNNPGVYSVSAILESGKRAECAGTEDQCRAKFQILVKSPMEPVATMEAPVNPSGGIPSILSSSDGTAYTVFTPEGGGEFIGEAFSFKAPAGAVPNGEYIGIAMYASKDASNIGQTHHRLVLDGKLYRIRALAYNQMEVDSYRLKVPGEVSLPLPARFLNNIAKIRVVAMNQEGTLTILQSKVKFIDGKASVVGNLSALPATVAVGMIGAPGELPSPTPEPESMIPITPDTGGFTLGSRLAVWLLIAGVAIAMAGAAILKSRRFAWH